MLSAIRVVAASFAAVAVLVIAGCGGGGGGGGSTLGAPPPVNITATPLPLTASTAINVGTSGSSSASLGPVAGGYTGTLTFKSNPFHADAPRGAIAFGHTRARSSSFREPAATRVREGRSGTTSHDAAHSHPARLTADEHPRIRRTRRDRSAPRCGADHHEDVQSPPRGQRRRPEFCSGGAFLD